MIQKKKVPLRGSNPGPMVVFGGKQEFGRYATPKSRPETLTKRFFFLYIYSHKKVFVPLADQMC